MQAVFVSTWGIAHVWLGLALYRARKSSTANRVRYGYRRIQRHDGRKLRALTLIDAYRRECLSI